MKYFLPLVQEMEVKIPAPVCKVVAYAATARTSFPSVVLHEESDSESRSLASFELPGDSCLWPPTSTYWQCLSLILSSPTSSATLFSTSTLKGEHQIGHQKKQNLIPLKFWLDQSVPVTQLSIDEVKAVTRTT